MKKLFQIIRLCLLWAVMTPSWAATATGTFDVSVNLTSVCEFTTMPAPAFTYTSFQASAATFSDDFGIRCTNTLPITSITLDATTVTDQSTGLEYTLALSGSPAAGTGVSQAVTITGSMAAGQAGTCNTATCSNTASLNKQRTLTIEY